MRTSELFYQFIGKALLGSGLAVSGLTAFVVPCAAAEEPAAINEANAQASALGICQHCQRPKYRCQCCPPAPHVPSDLPPPPSSLTPDAPAPTDTLPQTTMDFSAPQAPQQSQLAGFSQYMMGDSFSAGGVSLIAGDFGINASHPAAVTSRISMADNGTPIPQDRCFISNRTWIDVAPIDIFASNGDTVFNSRTNSNVNRTTVGFEKTFWSRLASFELRVPFNHQLDSQLQVDYVPDETGIDAVTGLDDRAYELGNIGLAVKFKLIETQNCIVSAGMNSQLPTAHAVNLQGRIEASTQPFVSSAGDVYTIDNATYQFLLTNETVNLTPFLAMSNNLGANMFAQSFLQLDIPVYESHGSYAFLGDVNATTVAASGVLDAELQTLLRYNQQVGLWLLRNGSGMVRNWAALAEFSYTGTLTDAVVDTDLLTDGGVPGVEDGDDVAISLGPGFNRQDIYNVSLGTGIDIRCMNLLAGYVIPLNSGDRKPFDGEYTFQLNMRR